MHPPPSSMAHNSTTLYQTITNTLGRTSTRSNSSSSTASNRSQSSQRSPTPSSHKRTLSQQKTSSAASYTNTASALPRGLVFDYIRPEEVRPAHALEVEGFSPEDAASYERLLSRQTAAPHLFLGAFVPMPPPKVAGPLSVSGQPRRRIVGFITGTAAPALTLRSMSTHDTSEDARIVCIHSVCIAPEMQRKGLATRMLENYIARIRKAEEGKGPEGDKGKRGYETLALLAHEELTGLYKKVGFRIQCVSHIQYGSGQWLEMRRSVYSSPATGPGSKIGSALARTASATSSGSDDAVATAGIKTRLAAAAAIPSAKQDPPSSTPSTPVNEQVKAPVAATQSKAVAPAACKPNSPPGMPSQASIMAALAAQSQPGKSPGQTFTSLLGQAVAAKTPAEDAGMALEARLVDRDTGSNLAKLYCPMENCRCCILAKHAGEWTRKESGPLSNPALELPNSPSPPQGPAFPIHHAAKENGNHRLLTTVKGFWMVNGPLQFDNVGFSRDIKWTAPANPMSPKVENCASPLTSNITELTGQRTKAQEKDAKEKQKREEKERQKEGKEKKKKEKRDRKRGGGSGSDSSDEDIDALLSHLSLGLTPGEELTVKYLLCPDCECGPLGFSILPTEMQGGRLAVEVGDQVERMKGGTMGMEGAAPKSKPQMFYLAADRVRYLFERS
ncbi:uncharacterized protein MEPE_00140 [Melanopsichium pennsylvanicum]|uniref:N-acetyltransferase domain-containing protein n=2 Tax=Melanopsichium pennsylvanicum TaxID=63383 RepID=A0AAJ5C2C9_9BASI|nr:uncharacterized protein MEPE_00140 [Melanopsichium pennsylvanicum]